MLVAAVHGEAILAGGSDVTLEGVSVSSATAPLVGVRGVPATFWGGVPRTDVYGNGGDAAIYNAASASAASFSVDFLGPGGTGVGSACAFARVPIFLPDGVAGVAYIRLAYGTVYHVYLTYDTSTHILSLYTGGTLRTQVSGVVSLNGWLVLEIAAHIHNTAGAVYVYQDYARGTPLIAFTGDTYTSGTALVSSLNVQMAYKGFALDDVKVQVPSADCTAALSTTAQTPAAGDALVLYSGGTPATADIYVWSTLASPGTPGSVTITIGDTVLTSAVGARTPGANDFDGTLGSTTLLAAEIAAAINDPLNSFGRICTAAASVGAGDMVTLTSPVSSSLRNSVALSTAATELSATSWSGGTTGSSVATATVEAVFLRAQGQYVVLFSNLVFAGAGSLWNGVPGALVPDVYTAEIATKYWSSAGVFVPEESGFSADSYFAPAKSPASAGDRTEGTPTTTNWQDVADGIGTAADSSSVSASAAGVGDLYNFADLVQSDVASLAGVHIYTRAAHSGASIVSLRHLVKTGGVVYKGVAWTTPTSYGVLRSSYGHVPGGASIWSLTAANAAQYGFEADT